MSNFPIDVCSIATEHKIIIWDLFARNGHYEDDNGHAFNKSSTCYVGICQQTEEPLLFCAVRSQPSQVPNTGLTHRSAWRVTNNEDLICTFDDAIGELMLSMGRQLYANTPLKLHGEYRQSSHIGRRPNTT